MGRATLLAMPLRFTSPGTRVSWALVAVLLLASAGPGDTRPGDDFLTAAVIPSAAPAASGALITVAGSTLNPKPLNDKDATS